MSFNIFCFIFVGPNKFFYINHIGLIYTCIKNNMKLIQVLWHKFEMSPKNRTKDVSERMTISRPALFSIKIAFKKVPHSNSMCSPKRYSFSICVK